MRLVTFVTHAEWIVGWMTLILTPFWIIGLTNVLISFVFMFIFTDEVRYV